MLRVCEVNHFTASKWAALEYRNQTKLDVRGIYQTGVSELSAERLEHVITESMATLTMPTFPRLSNPRSAGDERWPLKPRAAMTSSPPGGHRHPSKTKPYSQSDEQRHNRLFRRGFDKRYCGIAYLI
jgi:hypothetical protein